ncbi:MAG TPA: hypothetical protein VG479_12710 [Gaiellaceae bacterium]|jgi:hypothetical protein|nr:hypothetical protein [Gaiellaceae bacterium]
MVNKRKAAIGYTTYMVAKPVAKWKLRRQPKNQNRKKIAAAATAAVATLGAMVFWRKRRAGSAESAET